MTAIAIPRGFKTETVITYGIPEDAVAIYERPIRGAKWWQPKYINICTILVPAENAPPSNEFVAGSVARANDQTLPTEGAAKKQ